MPRSSPLSLLPLAVILASLGASGCAATHRPPASVETVRSSSAGARLDHRATVDALVTDLARRAKARGDHTLDVLYLSGGGQNGAYGIGFLRGWQSRADAPMPTFDLVTGVSTGALQAPFAFVGSPAALASGAALYRNAVDEFAPRLDWWFWLRKTGGVVDATKYKATIARVVDAPMQATLRQRLDDGRHLCVATTDMDLGVGAVWDVTREIGTTAEGRDRVHAILTASSAIPGIFPPVVLDDHVHGDGGVISNVLAPLGFDDWAALGQRLAAEGVEGAVTVRVWVVMNVWTHPRVAVVDPASRKGLGDRAQSVLFVAQQPLILQHLADQARAVSGQVPNVKMDLRVTAIPLALAGEPGADELFDKAWMNRLEAIGYERARGADAWDPVPSPYERPAKPAPAKP